MKTKNIKFKYGLFIMLTFFVTFSFNAQNNNEYSNQLKEFIKDYPMYKDNLQDLYFERVNYNVPKRKHYFKVYKRDYVGNENSNIKFYENRTLKTGRLLYILYPISFSTYRRVISTTPPPNVKSEIRCIIISKDGPKNIPLTSVVY